MLSKGIVVIIIKNRNIICVVSTSYLFILYYSIIMIFVSFANVSYFCSTFLQCKCQCIS